MLFSTNYIPYGLKKTCSEAYAQAYFMLNTVNCCSPPFSYLQGSIVILHLAIPQLAKKQLLRTVVSCNTASVSLAQKQAVRQIFLSTDLQGIGIITHILYTGNFVLWALKPQGQSILIFMVNIMDHDLLNTFARTTTLFKNTEKNIALNQHSPANKHFGASTISLGR